MKTKTRDESIRELRSTHSKGSNKTKEAEPPARKDGKKLDQFLGKLRKKYKGEDVLTTIANSSRSVNVKATPSGWQELDDLLTGDTDEDGRSIAGTGLGWPRGRIVEIYGEEGVGKTTLTLHIINAFQRAGERAGFCDAEHALDITYARKLGTNIAQLQLNQPGDGGERALDIIREMCASNLFGVIVVDSVAALEPQSDIDADFEDNAQPGSHARLMSRALRRLTAVVHKSNTLLVFTNQNRSKIGVKFGNPNTTTGGKALKFYASIRIEMTNMKTVKKGDRFMYRRIRLRTVKNKVAAPIRDVYVDIAPNRGIIRAYADPDLGETEKPRTRHDAVAEEMDREG